MMAVADVEADTAEAVGIIQLAGGENKTQKWCSKMMAQRWKCTPTMISYHMSGTGYQRLIRSETDKNNHFKRGHVKMIAVL